VENCGWDLKKLKLGKKRFLTCERNELNTAEKLIYQAWLST